MHDLCIVFHYHQADDETAHRLSLLRRHNPTALIVPTVFGLKPALPGTVDIAELPGWESQPSPPVDPQLSRIAPEDLTRNGFWRYCHVDTTLLRWFAAQHEPARRYVYLEYDVLCTMPLADAYGEGFDADLCCAALHTPTSSPWFPWFSEIDKLPPAQRPFAAAVTPLTGLLLSHRAMEQVARHAAHGDVFCELRIGTAMSKSGFPVTLFPPSLARTLCALPYTGDTSAPGLYHPVKGSVRYSW